MVQTTLHGAPPITAAAAPVPELVVVLPDIHLGSPLSSATAGNSDFSAALSKSGLDIGHVVAMGFEVGFVHSFSDGNGLATLSPICQRPISSATRGAPEYNLDKVILSESPSQRAPRPGDLLIFRTEDGGRITQWCSGSEFSKPRMPLLRTADEFTAEARHVLPKLSLLAGAGFSRRLLISDPSSLGPLAFGLDMSAIISTACDSVARREELRGPLGSIRRSTDLITAHLHAILVARDALATGQIEATRSQVIDRAITAHEHIGAMRRAHVSSLPGAENFDAGDLRALQSMFVHFNRISHLALRSMGVNYEEL